MPGALAGLRVIELAGLGPAPFCAMLLADHGADVVRVERPGAGGALGLPLQYDIPARGRRRLALDLREPASVAQVLDLVAHADVLIEGFRPGVMERLGLGPEVCLARCARLVYGRMTGWGQHGPLAQAAGHDINYIALAGALHAIGRAGQAPVPPLNYVGDYGGGAMLLAFGVLAALFEARRSGQGQVVDAAMTDGTALLSAMFHGLKAAGAWAGPPGTNMLDSGAHFYDTYRCADGKYVAVGAIEPQFYAELLQRLGLDPAEFKGQHDARRWPEYKTRLAAVFASRSRDDWCALLEGSDACFAPVLDWDEAPRHPHNVARGTYLELDGVVQPAPAPRLQRTPATPPRAAQPPVTEVTAILRAWARGTAGEAVAGLGPSYNPPA